MKTLLLLRHAKSSWSESGISDHDRPLNKRGLRTAPLMGAYLAEHDIVPDRIITSTAVRARDTAALIAKHSHFAGDIEETGALYPPTISRCAALLREVGDEVQPVMLVAHNPGIEEFVQSLVGHYERMPTCALAVIQVAIDHWSAFTPETQGELVAVRRPRDLFPKIE